MSEDQIGSMALLPKRPRVWGDDQTTTRMGKALAMAVGIDLSGPQAESMRRHRRAKRRVGLVTAAIAAFAIVLAVREAARWLS